MSHTAALADMFLHHDDYGYATDATEHVQECSSVYSFTSFLCYISQPLEFVLKFFKKFTMQHKVMCHGVCLTQHYSPETEIVTLLLVFGTVSKQTNNGGLRYNGIRYIRLWIHTQYL